MNTLASSYPMQLPVPPYYMRTAEQKQVREMTGPMGRPAGDHRSAQRIIERSPVLRQFLDNRDNFHMIDGLKAQTGDWTTANPDLEPRANATYDLDKVLRFIDNVDDRSLNGSHSRNGKIDGISSDGYSTLDNSEASLLKAFSDKGYPVLRHLPT